MNNLTFNQTLLMKTKTTLLVAFLFSILSCNSEKNEMKEKQTTPPTFQVLTETQKEIIVEFSDNCAKNYFYSFDMYNWQKCLDQGLEKDTTIAYLWQQKAMPYFKAKKYEAGMEFLDKAVYYNKRKWLPYRGFIKCIFSKQYKEAILDFEEAIAMEGNQYEQDHSYQFHIALSYLQLNEFEKAEQLFAIDITRQENDTTGYGAHHLDLFYYGITKFELQKWEEAIEIFDKALAIYPNFSEVLLYKGISLYNMGNQEKAEPLLKQAREEGLKGNTINESNVIYEDYPYQRRWRH